MTDQQITKKLTEAGIDMSELTVKNGEIELMCGYVEENGHGSCDEDAISKLHTEIFKVMPEFAKGISTGYDSLRLIQGKDYIDMGDPMDKGSRYNY